MSKAILFWLTFVVFLGCGACSSVSAMPWDNPNGSYSNASGAIVSSNAGPTHLTGLSINQIVGANRFYSEGYSGSRAIVANVEGGHIWSGHETMGHVSEFFDARQTYLNNGVSFQNLGQFDRHATWVGHVIGGRETAPNQEYQKGIAYGAQMWSGSIATTYGSPPWSNSWGWSRGYAFTDAYSLPTLVGRNGRTADVVNSSWGFVNSGDPAISGGNNIFTVTVDGIARQSRATFVFIAGNERNGSAVRAPGNGYNAIVVGALGSDTSPEPYSTISGFSTRGPQMYNGPDGNFAGVRARVDITAPGQNMSLAFYGGLTGGNIGGTDPSGGSNRTYTSNAAGTSFAAATVAGGATLLADVAYDRFADNVLNARDGQVIKAVLLNSATKPASWNNGQALDDGVVRTSQALDYQYGAGLLNLNRAFDQYVSGTTDFAGLGGGSIANLGWDYGIVNGDSSNDYFFDMQLVGGTEFSATLNWFVGRSWLGTASSGSITSADQYFTNLNLEMWTVSTDGFGDLVAVSDAAFINTQHFSFFLPETNNYALRVVWSGERYDFVGNSQQTYGLAWRGTAVPEPSSALLLLGCFAAMIMRRRRRI